MGIGYMMPPYSTNGFVGNIGCFLKKLSWVVKISNWGNCPQKSELPGSFGTADYGAAASPAPALCGACSSVGAAPPDGVCP